MKDKSIKKLYTGQSGLHMIASILAMRGYNFAIPMVDDGVDLIAIDIDPNKIFSIQVKSYQNVKGSNKQLSVDIPIQRKFIEGDRKIVDFVIFPIYMPLEFGKLSPSSRWWNIIFPWDVLHSLCSGKSPIGVLNQPKGKPEPTSRTIYIKYKKIDKKLLATRPQKGSKKNPTVDLSEYCDGLNENIWDKHFPPII
jgi:hypothetical protein